MVTRERGPERISRQSLLPYVLEDSVSRRLKAKSWLFRLETLTWKTTKRSREVGFLRVYSRSCKSSDIHYRTLVVIQKHWVTRNLWDVSHLRSGKFWASQWRLLDFYSRCNVKFEGQKSGRILRCLEIAALHKRGYYWWIPGRGCVPERPYQQSPTCSHLAAVYSEPTRDLTGISNSVYDRTRSLPA